MQADVFRQIQGMRADVSGEGQAYLTVSAHSLDALAEKVNELMADGYTPSGPVADSSRDVRIGGYSPTYYTMHTYIQPTVRA